MSDDLPTGVCRKGGNTYRRFKVKREGRWVDLYVKLPAPGEPGFWTALEKANAAAEAGEFGHEIEVR